ncbi:6-bladed beta-propeller [Gemmatimonadota bacterium]
MRPYSSALLALLFLSTFACSAGKEQPTEYSFRIFDENGVSVAETMNGPKYSSPLFTVEEVARIHEDESIQQSLLTGPRWMGIDEEGMIYVFDGMSHSEESRLVVFDQVGCFSHVIGRTGYGPGEYRDPDLLSISRGVISLYDAELRRISWFSTDGEFLRLFTCAPDESLPGQAYLDSENYQILIYRTRTSRRTINKRAITLSPDGEPCGIVETQRVRSYAGLELNEGLWTTPPHFCGSAMIDYSPDHDIMCTTGNEAVVEWYGLAGELQKVFRLGLEPGPVTEEDRALADSYFRDLFLVGSQLGEDLYREWKRRERFPKSRAFWNDASIDEYGYLWLTDPSSHFHPTVKHYRVVAPDGEYLGDCFLPNGLPQRFGRISRGHYLLMDIDWRGERQDLIVYRLKPAIEGLQFPE